MLADPRLRRDYISKIMQALSQADNATELILKYVRTAKPALTQPDDIDLYTLALAESNFLEAWQFQRSFPDGNPIRPRLIGKILNWALSRELMDMFL